MKWIFERYQAKKRHFSDSNLIYESNKNVPFLKNTLPLAFISRSTVTSLMCSVYGRACRACKVDG